MPDFVGKLSQVMVAQQTPLIVHVIFRLGVGGLENGLVNIINRLPEERYRHAIISLTDSTDFRHRLTRQDVAIYEIHKQAGQDWRSFVEVYRLIKRLQPAVVHTRNLAAIEYQICAFIAGVPYRLHGEHGWDVFDPNGRNVKYQWLRRLLGLLIHRFIPLSRHLQDYLQSRVGIAPGKITRICNGVDTAIFQPRLAQRKLPLNCPFQLNDKLIIGTVGRMHGVKDQMTLVKAYIRACSELAVVADNTCLWLVGEGPLRQEAMAMLQDKGLAEQAWLPGKRDDIAEIMRAMDVFVLPSKAEGISNTILEAMATGLPVIATRVGGNAELVVDGETGYLVAAENDEDMAQAIAKLVVDEDQRQRFGAAAQRRVHQHFSIDNMVARYQQVYDGL